MPRLLTGDHEVRQKLRDIAASLSESSPEAAFVCVDALVDAAIESADFQQGAQTLQEFVHRVPGQITALLKLVEVCVDGGFESAMYEAQVLLTDAYLESGQAAEARVIAEDLVAREPWESAHIDRFRQALVMLRVSDPDTEIAERLSGQSPFMATDPFVDLSDEQFLPAPEPSPEPVIPTESYADTSSSYGYVTVPDDGRAAEPEGGQESSYGGAEPDSPAEAAGPSEPVPSIPARPVAAPAEHEEIDLTSALGTLDGGIGGSTRRTASEYETQPEPPEGGSPDYSSQHMTLARTYLEMGMHEQAEAALRSAVQSPRLRFEAGALLGRMMRQRGDTLQALEWLERASEAPPSTVDEGRELMYDFGVTLDEAGETARALAVFLELQAEAGDYRDVPERIDRLARVQSGG
jgi:tetratricopeptide (TPR) repeat protein